MHLLYQPQKLQKLRGLGCRGLVKQHLYIKRGALRLFSIGIVRAVRVMSSLIAAFLWPSLLVEGQKAVFLAPLASKLQKLVRHFCGFCFFFVFVLAKALSSLSFTPISGGIGSFASAISAPKVAKAARPWLYAAE